MTLRTRPISLAAASFALLLPGCAAPDLPKAGPGLVSPAVSEMTARCRSLEEVDLTRIGGGASDWSGFEQLHSEARRSLPPPPADAGTMQLRLAISGGSIQAPYGLSVWAARQDDRTWRVLHVRYLQLRPPPPPPGTASLPQPPERVVTTGRLNDESGRLIEAALASDCLALEPLTLPAALPMKNGPDLMCPPDAGGSNGLEIREGGRVRRYLRPCGRSWATGAIIIALENSGNIVPM